MGNEETSIARDYHDGTKHPDGKYIGQNTLFNPKVRPILYKQYKADFDTVDLNIAEDFDQFTALKALETDPENMDERFPFLESLSQLLHYSAGITTTINHHFFGKMKFRAASCTGALYHIELYLVNGRLPGLKAGVYHYDPNNSQLQLLRDGDYRKFLLDASGNHHMLEDAPATIVYTSAYWRNAYKYQARAYRHAFWDSGVILSHSLALARMLDLRSELIMGFEDEKIQQLLGIDLEEEIPLALLPLGYSSYAGLVDTPGLEHGVFATKESELQRSYPQIVRMHKSSTLSSSEEVESWRSMKYSHQLPDPTNHTIQLRPQSVRKMPDDPLEQVIVRRGSTRKFSPFPISLQELSNLLKQGTQGIPADFYAEFGQLFNDIYLIVNSVDTLDPGAYVFHTQDNQLEQLKTGYFRGEAKTLGLNQDLAGDAAVDIFFMADLDALLEKFGNRGYRVAQMEASIIAGKFYLAAYAQDFGATGLTFYDDMVVDFFSPHANGKIVTFMLCLGHKKKD